MTHFSTDKERIKNLYREGKVEDAWLLSTRLMDKYADDPDYFNDHAVIAHSLGKNIDAKDAIKKAKKLAPYDENIRSNYSAIVNQKINHSSGTMTLQDIQNLVGKVHQDKIIQMLNAIEGTSVTIIQGDQQLKINNFSKSLAITSGPVTYCQDGLATVVDSSFMTNKNFIDAYESGKATNSWGRDIHWRMYNACWAAKQAKNLDGDFVECGVNKGGSAITVIKYTDFQDTNKKFWLLDTYRGVDNSLLSKTEKNMGIGTRYNNNYNDCYDEVLELFEGYSNVEIIKGRVPETLSQVTADKISYLHIDMNNATPEIAAAEYFWDRLVSGAIMLLDDYAWRTHKVQKEEFDKFASKIGIEILSMPTGQGLIIKN